MRVWNIKVTDRGGSDDYSFIQEHTPTEQQLNQVKEIYQNSGRYIKEELDDKAVEFIRNGLFPAK